MRLLFAIYGNSSSPLVEDSGQNLAEVDSALLGGSVAGTDALPDAIRMRVLKRVSQTRIALGRG